MTSRVLFVCSGNICRSPLAEYLARATFSASDRVFESAGTHALQGEQATANMISVGSELGVDLQPHRSQSLRDVADPDLILCMENNHVSAARHAFPRMPKASIRLLDTDEIADPYGNDLATYKACATQIQHAINRLDI